MSTNSFSIFTSALSLFTHNTNENNADYYRALDELKPKRTLPILSWIEKIVIIIDYLQIFGILWITAQPWPWPFQWSLYTRPLLYINLDFFSAYNEEGALAGRSNITSSRWGQMENYWLYVAIFTGVQFFFYLLIYCKYLYIKLFSYGKKISVQLDYCKAVGLAASLLLFVPCTLTVFRLFYCEYNTNTSNKINNLHNYYLSADPAIECLGTTHIVLLTVCTFLNTIVMVTLPTMMYKIVNKNLIYADKNDHEKRVQMWELLYIYDISNTWIKQQQWIMSSFTLAGSYYYIHLFIYKLLLLLTFALIRSDFIAQSLAFVFITSTFCCYYMFINRPFRSIVSNIILVITLALQIFNSVFGMCNSFGVRNAVMVSSTQSVVLGAYNMISFMCIAVVLVYMYLSSIPDWPAMKTIKRIRNNKYHTVKVIKWIEVMRESVTIKNDFIASPIEIADINNLEDIIRLLRQCLLQAKANGSIFETPISDILEELLLIHSTHHKHALRRFNYWDTEYSAIDKDSNLVKRTNNYVLMTPAKRKILTKLLAYRFLKGNRGGGFDMQIAIENKIRRKIWKKKHKFDPNSKLVGLQRFTYKMFAKDAEHLFHDGEFVDEDLESQMPLISKQNSIASMLVEKDNINAEGENLVGRTAAGRWYPRIIDEASKMIERLQERTELGLKKGFENDEMYKKDNNTDQIPSMIESENFVSLAKTLDEKYNSIYYEEQRELEELYLLWDEAIQLYEVDDFPGEKEKLDEIVENWYTYRGLLAKRLEVLAGLQFDEIIEEEEYDDFSPREDDKKDKDVVSPLGGLASNNSSYHNMSGLRKNSTGANNSFHNLLARNEASNSNNNSYSNLLAYKNSDADNTDTNKVTYIPYDLSSPSNNSSYNNLSTLRNINTNTINNISNNNRNTENLDSLINPINYNEFGNDFGNENSSGSRRYTDSPLSSSSNKVRMSLNNASRRHTKRFIFDNAGVDSSGGNDSDSNDVETGLESSYFDSKNK